MRLKSTSRSETNLSSMRPVIFVSREYGSHARNTEKDTTHSTEAGRRLKPAGPVRGRDAARGKRGEPREHGVGEWEGKDDGGQAGCGTESLPESPDNLVIFIHSYQ